MALEQDAWIRRLKARDEAALAELVVQFSASLGRYLLGMVRHTGEAEELAQEAFVRFFAHLDEFRGDASPRTFLFKIATNLALNHLDSASYRREVFPGELPERASSARSPFEGVARSEEAASVREALGSLPPQQRAVVVLRGMEDLSFREIASVLGIAEGTAKAHHFFALRSLRRIWRLVVNHERALTYALAGGPAPQEALSHVGACPQCSAELVALRGVEERLRAAAPSRPVGGLGLRTPPFAAQRSERSQRGWSTAAAACLALAFLATWVGQRPPARTAQVEVVREAPSSVATYAWPGGEYSTPAVLDAVQEELAASSATSGEGAASYWATTTEGEIP